LQNSKKQRQKNKMIKRNKTLAERVKKEIKTPCKETTFVKAFIIYSITAFILTFLISIIFMSIENPSMTGLAVTNTTINETEEGGHGAIVSGHLMIYAMLMLAFLTSIGYITKKFFLKIEARMAKGSKAETIRINEEIKKINKSEIKTNRKW